MKNPGRNRLILTALFVGFLGAFMHSHPTYAKTSNTPYNDIVTQKALLTGAYKCYTRGAVTDTVEYISKFSTFATLVNNDVRVPLPTGLTPITNDAQDIGCKGLFAGDATGIGTEPGTFEGLFSLSGKKISGTDKPSKVTLLTGMGYEEAGYTDEDKKVDSCIVFTYKEKLTTGGTAKEVQTENICAALDENQKITKFNLDSSTATYNKMTGSGALPFFQVTNDGKIRFARATKSVTNHGYTQTTYKDTTMGVGDTWDDFVENVNSTANTEPNTFTYKMTAHGATISYTYSLIGGSTNGNTEESSSGDTRYEFAKITRSDSFGSRDQKAGTAAINYLAKGTGPFSSFGDLSFSKEERLSYYLQVLIGYYFEGANTSDYWRCNVTDWSHYSLNFDIDISIDPRDVTKKKNCKLNSSYIANGRRNKTFTAFYQDSAYGDKYFFGSAGASFDFLIESINRLADPLEEDDTPSDDPDVRNPDPISGDQGGGESGVNKVCLEKDRAGSVSWIVCPTVEIMAEGTDGLYSALKDMLTIDSNLVSQIECNISGDNCHDNPTYSVWQYFRDAANITFIIALLIVIFSQVTGFGIDNYGIKKMLPKIVIAAVLINLSYIICQMAVDLSNVIGSSLSIALDSIAKTVDAQTEANTELAIMGWGGTLGSVALVGGGVLAVNAVPVIIAILGAGTIGGVGVLVLIIPVIIALLVAIVSVVMFFVTLALQKILIVICVAISPLAFVCYMLPNTQNLFKRWWDIFKGVLFLFPICSALYGIGSIIKVIILHSESGKVSFWMAVLAVVAPLLPYLLVPSLLRKAMSAAGDIGAKLQGFGSSMKQGLRNASSAVKDSDRYKDAQRTADMARQQRIVANTQRVLDDPNINGRRRRYLMHRNTTARDKLEKYNQQERAMQTLYDENQYHNLSEDELGVQWAAAYDAHADNLGSLTTLMLRQKHGADIMADYMESHALVDANGNVNQNRAASLQELRHLRDTDQNISRGLAKVNRAEAMISRGGMINGAYRNMDAFVDDIGNSGLSNDNIAGQSTRSIRYMAEHGLLDGTHGVSAADLLNSDDQNLRDLQSDRDKANILRAIAYMQDNPGYTPATPRNADETQFQADVRTFAPMYQASQSIAAADQQYRDEANEVFRIKMNGSNVQITGYSAQEATAGTWHVVQNNGHNDHVVQLASGNTWNAETGTLTINHAFTDPADTALLSSGTGGFRFAGNTGGVYTYEHADGRIYTYDSNSNTHTISRRP